jgi:hypothetical protein
MVQIIIAHIMPRGKSRCGFLHSSAVVEIASKPIYAKNTAETPFKIPLTPLGANGSNYRYQHKKHLLQLLIK